MKCAKLLLLVVVGCSNSNPQVDGGMDAAMDVAQMQDTGGMDSGQVVNGCTSFTDMTASGGTITGPSNANPSQFSPNCVHIKTGQMVTWNVDFTNHPLGASGGTTPSPIQTTSSGTMVSFTFGSTGTYGFHCLAHPSIMFGAVLVTQ